MTVPPAQQRHSQAGLKLGTGSWRHVIVAGRSRKSSAALVRKVRAFGAWSGEPFATLEKFLGRRAEQNLTDCFEWAARAWIC
jgi:hypothetical protein